MVYYIVFSQLNRINNKVIIAMYYFIIITNLGITIVRYVHDLCVCCVVFTSNCSFYPTT